MVNIREIVLNILMEYDKDGGRKTTLLRTGINSVYLFRFTIRRRIF